ncbi:hypothetical protein C1H46_000709 [Malus baccata]|uniref:F-box domain-containing protein n=1 Tax=Malus baccata TaxID=106549 RepID=A0A540NRP8_MALBA|nr:hypothetical protein C1H46_000709 [Malus baccata]
MKGDHTATKGIRCNTLRQSVGAHSDSDHLSHHSKGSKLPPRVPSHALSSDKLPDTLLVEIFGRLPRESVGRCKCVKAMVHSHPGSLSMPQQTGRRIHVSYLK